MPDLTQQYEIAKERAVQFVRAHQLETLWPDQAALDIICYHTDIYERGISEREQAQRLILRTEWLARVSAPPCNGIQFGYRDIKDHD